MESVTDYLAEIEAVELLRMQAEEQDRERQRSPPNMSRANNHHHDSARSTSYAKQDSGFITNSSLVSEICPRTISNLTQNKISKRFFK